MAMTSKIRNVHVSGRQGELIALTCEVDGARYHIWMNPTTGALEDAIYKNPLDGGRGFKTRKLNAASGPMSKMIQTMLGVYHQEGLLKKSQEKESAEEKERLTKAHEEWRRKVKQQAGEDLYRALKTLVIASANGSDLTAAAESARELLGKIDKEIGS